MEGSDVALPREAVRRRLGGESPAAIARDVGRTIPLPDGTAYQYVTATLDLALPDERNLLISDSHGALITIARLAKPRS